jgi:hypothetical protein
MLPAMKSGVLAMLVMTLAVACGDGSPVSGEYCSPSEAAKCTTISFPSKRGTDVPGTMQIEGRRYEVRWMDTESGRRTYIANLPGGSIAFDMTAVDARTVAVRWRDKRPEQTYALK